MRLKPEELPQEPACSGCAFSEMHEQNDRWFYCRRRAPAIGVVGKAAWAICVEDDWCGEFKAQK